MERAQTTSTKPNIKKPEAETKVEAETKAETTVEVDFAAVLEQQAAEERAAKEQTTPKQLVEKRVQPVAQMVQVVEAPKPSAPPWEEEVKPASMPIQAESLPIVAKQQLDAAVQTNVAPEQIEKSVEKPVEKTPDDMQHVRAAPDSPQAHWNHVVSQLLAVDALHAFAGQLAVQSECLAFDGSQLHLCVGQDKLRSESAQTKLRAVLMQHAPTLETPWGGKIEVEKLQWRVERGAVTQSYRLEQEAVRGARQQAAEAAFMAMPTVQSLMQQFDATVVKDSIQPLP